MNWLYSSWWKWVCVVLLSYVVIGGLLVPMGPGLPVVYPGQFYPDSTYTFTVTGYRTHFANADAGKVQLWFTNGGKFYVPQSIKVLDDSRIQASFGLSAAQYDSLKQPTFDIVANDDYDGTIVLREGVAIEAYVEPVDTNPIKFDSIVEVKDAIVSKGTELATVTPTTYADAKTEEPVVKHSDNRHFIFPYREILEESIRNTFYHVPMWFGMTFMVVLSLAFSVLYLAKGDMRYDALASNAVVIALLYGVCGYLTGALWSKYTWFIGLSWGDAIRNMVFYDIKLSGALISIAVYLAYLILRSSITDEIKRARISAVYSVFSVVIFILFIFIVPRSGAVDSLHPGQAGNPAFNKYDLDSHLRMFFYPAVIGWIMLGMWLLSIRIRLQNLQQKQEA